MKYQHIFVGLILLLTTGGVLLLVADVLIVPRFLEKSLSREQLLVGVTAIPHRDFYGELINTLGFVGDEITAGSDSNEFIRVVTLAGRLRLKLCSEQDFLQVVFVPAGH